MSSRRLDASRKPPELRRSDVPTQPVELLETGAFPGIYTSYAWKNLIVTLWYAAATPESLPVFERGCKRVCAEHPEGFSSVHLMVPGGTQMPSAQVRAELARILRDCVPQVAAASIVIPGTGFWASALRSMVTALTLLLPREFELKICGELGEVAQWLAPRHTAATPVSLEPAEILQALTLARRAAAAAA